MTNTVKYGDIDPPYFPTYEKLSQIITEKTVTKQKPYQKTLTFNLNLSGNQLISILDNINKSANSEIFHISRERDYAFHCLMLNNDVLVYVAYHQRPNHNYFRIGIEASSMSVLETFIQTLDDNISSYKVLYPTVDIRWYYKSSHGIDYSIFEEKAVTEINPLVYPYYDDVKKFVDDYILSNESVLILIGKPGTAKTSLIRYIISRYQELKSETQNVLLSSPSPDVSVYYTADQDVLSSDTMFIHFASETNACMVMEDIDIHLSSRSDGNTFMYKLLGSSDGLIKNVSRKIIISTNLPNVKDIDDALVRPGRCFGIVQHRELTYDEALELLNDINPEKAKKFVDFDKKEMYSIADLFSNRIFDGV